MNGCNQQSSGRTIARRDGPDAHVLDGGSPVCPQDDSDIALGSRSTVLSDGRDHGN